MKSKCVQIAMECMLQLKTQEPVCDVIPVAVSSII